MKKGVYIGMELLLEVLMQVIKIHVVQGKDGLLKNLYHLVQTRHRYKSRQWINFWMRKMLVNKNWVLT